MIKLRTLIVAILISFLFLTNIIFAGWLELTAQALLLSFMILALMYMIAIGFTINELKFLAQEEFWQLIVTVVMVALLYSTHTFFDSLFASPEFGANGGVQKASIKISQDIISKLDLIFENVKDQADDAGRESSISVFCSFMGTSVYVAACGSYRAITPIYSTSYQVLSIALMEEKSLEILLTIGSKYAFTIFLPLGIFLRTFKFTRGAGGFLIALSIAFYFVLPLTVFIFDELAKTAKSNIENVPPGSIIKPINLEVQNLNKINECDMYNPDRADENSNVDSVVSALNDMNSKSMGYLYVMLVNASLGVIIPIGAMIASIRAFSALAGAEVDVSALSRIA